ncbi:Xaa-Pro peptidase family protein [Microvirga sp. 0TCS3.31]
MTDQLVRTALEPATLSRAVDYAVQRTRASLQRHGLAAGLLFDAYNIRYVTGTSIMPIWALHTLDRYVLVPAEGPVEMWESPSAAALLPADRRASVRQARSWSVFDVGERSPDLAAAFADEIARVLTELGIREEPLGVDRLDTYGFLALQHSGLELRPAQLAMEEARSIKSPDEIAMIRHSVSVADAAITHMYDQLRPGMSENEAWAAFTAHAFAHGSEYVECRLLSSGPRTNPWFQEASDRQIEAGDIVSFDTDLIGPAGYLADVSRAYLVGSDKPTAQQLRLYRDAQEFLNEIMGAIRPGAAFDELGEQLARAFPVQYHAQRYPFIAHSSGLCDEYPTILFADHHGGQVETGMVFCVEAYVGVPGEREGMKLEEQVLVTDEGVELLSHAPHDPWMSTA